MANKVIYGICNVYYAKATDDGTGTLTYATPVHIPGARSISLSASGDQLNWAADNVTYFSMAGDDGYEGDLTMAIIPDDFKKDILGETLDAKGFYVERSGSSKSEFALLFQFEGDDKAVKHCLYRCTASRPAVNGNTVDGSPEPSEETITLRVMPRINDKVVKARAPYTASTTSSYATWFSAVQEPTA